MEKTNEITNQMHQLININDRKKVVLSGVKKIMSFDNEEFLLETILGTLLIKGKELEIIKLDTTDGNVAIKGHFNSLNYVESRSKNKEESIISKLFK